MNITNTQPSIKSTLLHAIGYDLDHHTDAHFIQKGPCLIDFEYEFESNIERHQRDAQKTLSTSKFRKAIRIDKMQEIFIENLNTDISKEENKCTKEEMEYFCKYSEERMYHDHLIRTKLKEQSKNIPEEKIRADHFLRSYIEYDKESISSNKTEDSNWRLVVKEEGVKIIKDKEWPLIASYIRILMSSPYGNFPFPALYKLYTPFYSARLMRLNMINAVSHYELYSENRLIFKKTENNLEFFDKKLFIELCSPIKNPSWDTITESFIEQVIEKGYIPEDCRKKLEKYKDFSIKMAIKESNIYGNQKKVQKFFNEELSLMEPLDQFIFANIQHICDEDLAGWREKGKDWSFLRSSLNLKQDYTTWMKTNEQYHYFSKCGHNDPHLQKLKNIFKYFFGKRDITSLNLTEQCLPELLKFVKMFNLSISISNCMRLKKIKVARGSYELLELIMKKSNLPSHIIFSKTLFNAKALDVSYMANPNNWLDRRVAEHMRLYANSMILAATLSGRIKRLDPTQKITSCRGNTGSGKTFYLSTEDGVLNVDHIKYSLKQISGVPNQKIHFEGKFAIFEHLFKQVANCEVPHFALNQTEDGLTVSFEMLDYMLDSRLIKPEFIKEYLIDPAKKRNYTVALNDLDVPFLTTLNRVLKRDPKGKDPIPTLMAMKDGLKEIRQYREDVIEYVKNEDTVEEYNLRYLGKIVAVKSAKGQIDILDFENYQKCFKVPSEQEFDKMINRVIDNQYIQEAILRGDIKEEESSFLECWKGITVKFALEAHANKA